MFSIESASDPFFVVIFRICFAANGPSASLFQISDLGLISGTKYLKLFGNLV